MESTRTKFVVALVGGSFLGYSVYRFLQTRDTREWIPVGTVGALWIYPVKSCYRKEVCNFFNLNSQFKIIQVEWVKCTANGPSQGELSDRQFVIVDEETELMCTARQMPKLAVLKVDVCARFLTVSTPEGLIATVNLEDVERKLKWRNAILRKGESSKGLDCGDEIAELLNQYCQGNHGVRMLYYPPSKKSEVQRLEWLCNLIGLHRKVISWLAFSFKSNIVSQHSISVTFKVSFVEQSPFYVTTESSLISLNERLDRPVTSANFRPNIVIEGTEAWEEDRWDMIRFGDETVLNCDKLCTRCTVTTVDPESGVKDAAMEPVRTMKQFRPVREGKMVNGRTGPVFGVNSSLIAPGVIRIGQAVYVKYK
ncbi:hypothetical protein PRIPAC_79674 [Pristionchus pacificus]|uniref:MOSC domain-containing protein n=1 Tax=Pristionchus pacificus TaxID=54126 RepID=A0A2A6C2M3_PRIPA|nr:hypothetical protein PRIPAC_79674 [Pristionchus pacificus]|eukprot:PDM72283.1 hypothetical protein PRIPAC_38717 [Pristionchus pacificus]